MADDSPGVDRLPRREVLSTVVAIGGVGMAGCTGDSGSTSQPGDPGTSTATSEATTTETTGSATVPLDEPVEVTDGDRCAVCNMQPAEYPEWNAQLSLDLGDRRRAHFCSPGCLVAFHARPAEFIEAATRDAIVARWARDHETTELVDATSASWVLELNPDRIEAPMMRNPVPFGNREDALWYVDQYDELTRHDVVGLDAFDLPLARKYRAKMLPESDDRSVLDAAAVPEDESCGVCDMKPAMFPEANAQLSFEDGDRAYFCSPGCMTAYYGVPDNFDADRTRDDVVGAWAHDYGSGDLFDALSGSFVLETDADRIDLPMMKNPVPFADRADATEYVDRYDDLSVEDVVGLLAFDEDLARTYRGTFF